MDYSFGYVAFLDILGFSNLVLEESNLETVDNLIHFVNKFQYLFNTSPQLNLKVSFFSDSIVLTTDMKKSENLGMIMVAIHIAELFLYQNTGLYFRGGITKGKYYYSNSTVFGPAIIRAYQLESKAKYCRVMIDPEIIEEEKNNQQLDQAIEIIKDFDGNYYYSSIALHMMNKTVAGESPKINEVYQSLLIYKDEIISSVKNNMCTDVADKYIWRCVDFNRKLKNIEEILISRKITFQTNDVIRLKELKIDIDSILENGEGAQNDQL